MSSGHDERSATVEFENTVDDFVRFHKYWYLHKRPRMYWLGYGLAWATGMAIGQVLAGPRFTARSVIYHIVCSAVLLAAWSVFVYGLAPLITKMTMRRAAAKILGAVGRRRISLETGGVHETNDASKTMYGWRVVDAIEADKDCIYIFLLGGTGWVVPRRAFPTVAASDEFFATARRLHAQGAST